LWRGRRNDNLAVFDVLGLATGEREAVAELVRGRLEKVKSV